MPTPVIVLAVLAFSVVAAAIIDLTRHDVRVLPKWAWGLIVLVAFPFGVIPRLVADHRGRLIALTPMTSLATAFLELTS